MTFAPRLRYTLTEPEQRLARYIGGERQRADDAAAIPDRRVSQTRTSEEIHRDGFAAELAFCRLFNVYPDMTTNPRRGGHDCTVAGVTVDVKATKTGRLIVFGHKTFLASDCYALMLDNFPVFEFVGFISSASLFTKAHAADPKDFPPDGRPRFVANQSDLDPRALDVRRADE